MEREVSSAINLGVVLTAVAAVLSIVFFTVFVGKGMFTSVAEEASTLAVGIESGVLSDMREAENRMPVASVYSIIRTYGNQIPHFNCKLHSVETIDMDLTTGKSTCLMQHMRGKASVQVELLYDSWYKVTVHHPDCTWYYTGSCNCASVR